MTTNDEFYKSIIIALPNENKTSVGHKYDLLAKLTKLITNYDEVMLKSEIDNTIESAINEVYLRM